MKLKQSSLRAPRSSGGQATRSNPELWGKILDCFVISFLAMTALINPAHAESTVWTDADYGIVLTHPDGWMDQVVNHKELRLHIVAPAATDMAQCKLFAEEDGRFKIYPNKYLQDIVGRELGQPFWSDHFANYDNVNLNYLAQGGGLGLGYATYTDFSYSGSFNGAFRQMRGVAYATIYHDMRVVIECSSDARVFASWYPLFSSVVKSLSFEPHFHNKPYGAYRNFFQDYPIYIPEKGNGTGGY